MPSSFSNPNSVNLNNFTVGDESPIQFVPRTWPNDEHEPINEFMIATDYLDEPLLTTDPALEDSAPPTVSSRTLNNALE